MEPYACERESQSKKSDKIPSPDYIEERDTRELRKRLTEDSKKINNI